MALNNIMYEDVKDTISYGEKNFKTIDLKTMFSDFRLKEKAKARNNAFANNSFQVMIEEEKVEWDTLT